MTRLDVRTERNLVHARHGGSRHAVVSIRAPRIEGAASRRPMNLAFVLDRSGSMGRGKLELAKGAVLRSLDLLGSDDRFAVVVYDHEVTIAVPSDLARPDTLQAARDRLHAVQARGTTDLAAGWLTGCREVAQHLQDDQVARCLLFTDGLANRGETRVDILGQHARALRERGIVTSTFGIGDDFDEHLLRHLADEGGGNARYIESDADFGRLIHAELRDSQDVVHRDLVLRMSGPDTATIELIGPWPARRVDGGAIEVALGDVVSEELLEIVVRVHVHPGAIGYRLPITFSLLDRDGEVDTPPRTLVWTLVGRAENRAQPRDVEVDRIVAARHAARAREHAVLAIRRRDLREARRILERVADRIEQYAHGDRVLEDIVAKLRADARRYGRPMDVRTRKQEWYASTSVARGKGLDGGARRR